VPLGIHDTAPRFEPRVQRQLEERLAEPCVEVVGTLSLTGRNLSSLEHRAASLAAAISGHFDAGFGGLTLTDWDWETSADPASLEWPPDAPSILVTLAELASLWHIPSEQLASLPNTQFLRFPEVTIPEIVTKPAAICLGSGEDKGNPVHIYLDIRDFAQGGMTLILGTAGSGKSVTAEHIADDVLKLRDRKTGLVVIDPNNKLTEAIALRAVPKERLTDVILLNLGDPEYPGSLPFFAKPDGVSLDTFIQTNYSIFKLIFAEQWSNTAMAVLEFWREYEAMSPAEQQKLVRPIKTRMRRCIEIKVCNIFCVKRLDWITRSS
jgi:hypothetical protein